MIHFSRRRAMASIFALLAASTFNQAALLGNAQAQAKYPDRPVRVVVGFAAGGPLDILARVAASSMSKTLGQPIVVDNNTGASGNIATDLVGRSDPDGYTLMMSGFIHPVNETMFKTEDKIKQVAIMAESSIVLVVHPSLGVKSVDELVALVKSRPDVLHYATAGRGTATHLAAELFNKTAGIKMMPVHYRGGGDAIKDLLSGEVKIMFSTIPPVLSLVKDGRLIGLATTGQQRDSVLPDLATVAELGMPGYEVQVWVGLAAPEGVPAPIVEQLAAAMKTALDDPAVQKALAAQGNRAKFLGPVEANAFYDSEVARWAEVAEAIRAAGE